MGKRKSFWAFALVYLAALGVGCVHGAGLTLVQDGKPLARIVIDAEKPTRAAQFAAYELQHHVKLITGAELPIVGKAEGTKGVLILVGESDATRELKIRSGDFHGEEYLLKFAGNKIVLIGNDTPDYGRVDYADHQTFPALGYCYRSTTYAVYDFLERCCGVRFYSLGCNPLPAPFFSSSKRLR
ncbi:MAG: hypothetical protein GW893_10800 [Armatimonadetes bacterium]|nr:hypothetical protein [Armatimonadota bacterium]PJB73516.1 MAG: hypothetical protein CO095_05770 [Armatimonadetes bacterium CG_4_9_14_3_um_filter_58_7]